MTNPFLNSIDFLNSEALADDCIELSSAQLNRAARLSRGAPEPAQQWQTYLDALALFGFQQWLEEWAPDLRLDESACSLFQPAPFRGACYLQVEQLKLCLITTSSVLNPAIDCPKAIVDLPQFVPHLYVVVEVREEQMQVQIYGYLRSKQLMQQQQSLVSRSNGHFGKLLQPSIHRPSPMYAVPLIWFMPDPTALLVELRCLDLAPEQEPKQQPTPIAAPQAINVGDWLSDRLDEVTQKLNGVLLPLLIPATALRSAQELQLTGVQIPPAARGVSLDLQLGTAALRLYAATWVLSPAIESFGWTLLLVLSAQPQARLPAGLRLQVRDASQLLFEQALSAGSPDASLYAQVGGNQIDQFWITIDLPGGETLALPPFIFNL